ncbi:hypothetical protein A8C56_03695 [Niabella ginsenosidivorans]|uniref:Bacterial surface antigen (D15) domain-containing protein n=1 Tax=Niabella ginsenosidivorans TaxID=1176587 RepID=A0A1A9I8M4_9BACT|nr:hypothetical protein A8C56_03695 [Niabella ginsenosidivorans]
MRPLCLMALVFLAQVTNAQQFGGNPPSVHWRQLYSDTARIIYPEGLDTVASRVATIVNKIAQNNYHALGNQVKRIDIVLQNQPITSNGYVGLGPFRSEFYLMPPSDNFDQGTTHWADQLALHEFRHVEQYNNFNHGASKVMHWLFGQDGYAVAINAAVPNWFFEGDAVYQETYLSPQGRGRLPSFINAYPALWRSGKEYSWMKLRNGSLKDYVPNHYDLGYLLVNYGYTRYGSDFWRKVTTEAAAFKGLIYPMQKAIKRNTGLSYSQFVNAAFDDYKKRFGIRSQKNITDSLAGNNKVMPVNYTTLTHYYYPQQIDAGSMVYLKTSAKQRPAFYFRDRVGEHFVRYRDISSETQFSYSNGKIVYAALETDPRWSWKTYSSLRVLDLRSGIQKKVTRHTRYFSPDISVDGKFLVANEVDLQERSSLVLLDAQTGKPLKTFSQPGIDYFANPKIKNAHQIVAAVRQRDAATYIGLIDLDKKTIEQLTPPTVKPVGQISLYGDKVYFIGSAGLKDAVFCVDLRSHQIQKLAQDEFTAYFINAAAGTLNWSSFTADGYQLRQKPYRDAVWTNLSREDFVKGSSGIINDSVHLSESPVNAAMPVLPSGKYAQLTAPLNFHSWRPNYDNPEYSLTVYGNNILNTTQTQLYYLYNRNDRSSAIGGSFTYAGLYPYIGLGSRYTINRQLHLKNEIRSWNQWDNYLSVSVPLNWIDGRRYNYLNTGTNLGYRIDFNRGAGYAPSDHFGYLTHSLSFGQQVQRAAQDIYPKWGYGISLQYTYAINKWHSNQLYGRAVFYVPGFLPTHNFVFSLTAQQSSVKYQLFSNSINFARGFNGIDSTRMGTVTIDYHLPLWYPDWGFGNLLYIQRVRGAAFYDYTGIKGRSSGFYTSLQSAGAEVYLDTQWWNQHPLTFGLRVGRLLTKDPVAPGRNRLFYEFILPVSIIPK